MRTREELINLNISQLTQEEKEALGDMGLNCCDNCGEIDLSENLHWIDGEDYKEDSHCENLVISGLTAICKKCYDIRKEKIAQCGSCDNYFVAYQDHQTDCPHCHSCNWVYGCIDHADLSCFECKGNPDCQLEAYQDCQFNPNNQT
jgi:hypothetical protein